MVQDVVPLGGRLGETEDAANARIFDFIEAFYNPSRRHSSLGYLGPTNYEKINSAVSAA